MRKVIRRCCSCIEEGIESRKSCLSDLASVAGADMPNEACISASSVWLDDGGITLERWERKTRGLPVRCAMLNHTLTQAWKCLEWAFENSQNTSVERGFIEALCVKVDRCRRWVWKTGAGCECDRQVQVVMVKCVIQQGLCLELSFNVLYCRTQANPPTLSICVGNKRVFFSFRSSIPHRLKTLFPFFFFAKDHQKLLLKFNVKLISTLPLQESRSFVYTNLHGRNCYHAYWEEPIPGRDFLRKIEVSWLFFPNQFQNTSLCSLLLSKGFAPNFVRLHQFSLFHCLKDAFVLLAFQL